MNMISGTSLVYNVYICEFTMDSISIITGKKQNNKSTKGIH